MGPVIIPSSTRKGDPLTGSHEEGVLYGPFLDCYSVSGTQGQSGEPGTDEWDVPRCVWVCVHVCVYIDRVPAFWQCQDAVFKGVLRWPNG